MFSGVCFQANFLQLLQFYFLFSGRFRLGYYLRQSLRLFLIDVLQWLSHECRFGIDSVVFFNIFGRNVFKSVFSNQLCTATPFYLLFSVKFRLEYLGRNECVRLLQKIFRMFHKLYFFRKPAYMVHLCDK